MKHKFIILILSIAVLLVLAYYFMQGWTLFKFTSQMSTNERTSDDNLISWLENDKGFDVVAFRTSHKIEKISLSSSMGDHDIPAEYIYAEGQTNKGGNTVIMVHGLLGNRLSNYPMSQMFLNLGFNVLTYDQRSSGGNKAPYTTYGYLESADTVDYVNWLRSVMTEDAVLGVWGQSMGAATVANAMDEDSFIQGVDFVVLDSPLGDMQSVIGGRGFQRDLEKAFGEFFYRQKLGFSYDDQNVFLRISQTQIPALVVSSKNDHSVPFAMQEHIFQTLGSQNKQFYTVDDSQHSDIYFDHPEEYQQRLKDFVESVINTKTGSH